MLTKNFLISLTLLGSFSCSSETEDSTNVNQDRIFQLLWVNYDADKSEMEWFSSFTLGGPSGTTLELVEGSTTTVNGEAMEKITTGVSGTFYHRDEQSGFSTGPHNFYFKDSEDKEFTNSITMDSAELPSDTPSSFSKANDLTIAWTGNALSDDWIKLEITNKTTNDIALTRLNTSGASEITLTADDLSDVPAGSVEIQLVRYSDNKELTEATEVGGSISYNYYSATKDAEMTD